MAFLQEITNYQKKISTNCAFFLWVVIIHGNHQAENEWSKKERTQYIWKDFKQMILKWNNNEFLFLVFHFTHHLWLRNAFWKNKNYYSYLLICRHMLWRSMIFLSRLKIVKGHRVNANNKSSQRRRILFFCYFFESSLELTKAVKNSIYSLKSVGESRERMRKEEENKSQEMMKDSLLGIMSNIFTSIKETRCFSQS